MSANAPLDPSKEKARLDAEVKRSDVPLPDKNGACGITYEPQHSEETVKPSAKAQRRRFKEIIKVFHQESVVHCLLHQEHPEKVREAFEMLGATFIKIGQMLSVRTDLLDAGFASELGKLQDEVRTDPFSEVAQTIKQQTGRNWQEILQDLEPQPFASGSIGQTHFGRLKNGAPVAVKVQHPHIREDILLDLRLFERSLPVLERLPDANVVDLREILREIKESLLRELDYKREARNTKRFYELNNHWDIIETPYVYEALCTQKLLITEYKTGQSIKYFLAGKQDEKTTKIKRHLADVLIDDFIKSVFQDGFFHADPHPGNIFLELHPDEKDPPNIRRLPQHMKMHAGSWESEISWGGEPRALPDYRLILLDFGMVGELTEALRTQLSEVVFSLFQQDSYAVGEALLVLCKVIGPLEKEHFFEELDTFLETIFNLPLEAADLVGLFQEVVLICKRNHLQMPHEVTMLAKAFATLVTLVEELNPLLSLRLVLNRFAKIYLRQQLEPAQLKQSGENTLLSVWRQGKTLSKIPQKLFTTLDGLSSGKFEVELKMKEQEQILRRIEGMLNKTLFGILVAAIIIGSSLLVGADTGYAFVDKLGIAGYLLAAGVILAICLKSLFAPLLRWIRRRE